MTTNSTGEMAAITDDASPLMKLLQSQIPPNAIKKLLTHKLIAVTVAESTTKVFPDWVRRCFLAPSARKRCYHPYNLNMPISVLHRSRAAHTADPPLTEFGKVSSSIRANELLRTKNIPQQIFCSSELRSVETAQAIAAQLPEGTKILVDPSLSEWRNFDESRTEKHWLSGEQLAQHYPNVDVDYTPIRDVGDLPTSETPRQYCDRVVEFLAHVVQNQENCSLIVASSATFNLINGGEWKNGVDLMRLRAETPSCAIYINCVPKCRPVCDHSMLPFTYSGTKK